MLLELGVGSFYDLERESHDHEDLIGHLEAGNGERAAAFMGRHLKAIEASLSIVEEEDESPDLHSIFGR